MKSFEQIIINAGINPELIKIDQFDPDHGRSEGFGLNRDRGITLTYLPSKATASAQLHVQAKDNFKSAFKRLLELIPSQPEFPGEIDLALLKKQFDSGVLISKITVGKLIEAAIAKMYMETRLVTEAYNSGIEDAAKIVDDVHTTTAGEVRALKREVK